MSDGHREVNLAILGQSCKRCLTVWPCAPDRARSQIAELEDAFDLVSGLVEQYKEKLAQASDAWKAQDYRTLGRILGRS